MLPALPQVRAQCRSVAWVCRADWLVGPVLKTSHMDHHYVDETVGYGISSTLYDLVFGTMNLKAALLKKGA